MNRVIQFYRAIFSRIDSDDLEFIKKYLDRDCELDLFFAQHPADQKHAVNVARMPCGCDRRDERGTGKRSYFWKSVLCAR